MNGGEKGEMRREELRSAKKKDGRRGELREIIR
jgi:hypothetical protein